MEIYGKNYGFKLTVGAGCEIAEMCPGGELKNFRQLLMDGGHAETLKNRTALILALNRGYADAHKFETGEDAPRLSEELLRTLSPSAFGDALEAATAVFFDGLGVSVAVNTKKNGGDAKNPSP